MATFQGLNCLRRLRSIIRDVDEDLLHMQTITEAANCGTAHCALGWAFTDPMLRDKFATTMGVENPERGVTFYNQLIAAKRIFGVSDRDVERLFANEIEYNTDPHAISKDEVLNNLDRLIKGHEALPYATVVAQHWHDGCGEFSAYTGPCAGGRDPGEAGHGLDNEDEE